MKRILFIFFLITSVVLGDKIELPSVDVQSERIKEDTQKTESDTTILLPDGEDDKKEVFLFPGLTGKEPLYFKEKKNAIFSIGFGFYDRLNTSLILANSSGNFSWLFSVDRFTIDDFDLNGHRLLNSQNGFDSADLNIQYRLKNFQWNSRFQYEMKKGGLEQSPVFFDKTTRRIRLNEHVRWSLSSISSLNLDLVYDHAMHNVKNSLVLRDSVYHRPGIGFLWETMFSEMNSFSLSGLCSGQWLSFSNSNLNEGNFKITAADTFMLLSIFEINAKLGLIYSTRPLLYILPDLKITYLVNEVMRLNLFTGIREKENLMTDVLGTCNWFNAFNKIFPVSAEYLAGAGVEILFFEFIPFTLDTFFASETKKDVFYKDNMGLYQLKPLNTDSFGCSLDARLIKLKDLNISINYDFRIFERMINFEPLHHLVFDFKWEPSFIKIFSKFAWLSGMRVNDKILEDIFETSIEIRKDIYKNIALFLIMENLLDLKNSLYVPYVDKGFGGALGLRVNLI